MENLSRRSCTQSSTEIFKTSQGELAESNLVPLLHVPCNAVWDNDQLLSTISCSQPLKLNSKSRTPFWTVHHSGTTWYNSSPDCSMMKSERPSPFLAPQNPASHWSFVWASGSLHWGCDYPPPPSDDRTSAWCLGCSGCSAWMMHIAWPVHTLPKSNMAMGNPLLMDVFMGNNP